MATSGCDRGVLAQPFVNGAGKMNEINLKKHFSEWYDFFDSYTFSGSHVADRVNELVPNPSIVLDVGCGYNRLKGNIPNLIGCDIINPKADIIMDMMDLPFKENSLDCIIALGSINFYSRQHVTDQIRFLYSLLKPNGYMIFRGNPGEYGIVDESKLKLYSWAEDAIIEIADEIGFDVLRVEKDYIDLDKFPEKYREHKKKTSFRYYWEYQKR